MAMPLTQDEQLVLRHLVSGESSEEIAAALDWPLQVVRNYTHTLRTWVLDELGAGRRTPSKYFPAPPPVGREAESRLRGSAFALVVDPRGFEPLTFWLPARRSTS